MVYPFSSKNMPKISRSVTLNVILADNGKYHNRANGVNFCFMRRSLIGGYIWDAMEKNNVFFWTGVKKHLPFI